MSKEREPRKITITRSMSKYIFDDGEYARPVLESENDDRNTASNATSNDLQPNINQAEYRGRRNRRSPIRRRHRSIIFIRNGSRAPIVKKKKSVLFLALQGIIIAVLIGAILFFAFNHDKILNMIKNYLSEIIVESLISRLNDVNLIELILNMRVNFHVQQNNAQN